MSPDWSGLSAIILAVTGLIGAFSAWMLNRRGQTQQAIQQEAANDLGARAQAFDEMQALSQEQRAELVRRELEYDRRLAAQARRCRQAFDHFVLAFTTLQGQVVSEAVRREAEKGLTAMEQHLAEDHPEGTPE